MKTVLSFLLALLVSNITLAQTTAIPDSNFEQALINLGLDTGSPNGSVPTSNINSITSLNVSNSQILDLTGIQNFSALTTLDCSANQLASLDVSQNTVLTHLQCSVNQLTSLDVSQNIGLILFLCHTNQLTSLDVSQNIALTILECSNNQLTSLNVSQNTVLTNLQCSVNQLNCLNMQNGNNLNFTLFMASVNPNLDCITVDDAVWSTANWETFPHDIDATASFSSNCGNPCLVGIDDFNLKSILLYPNPTTSSINIDLDETKSNIKLRLTNAIGQVILTKNYKSTNHIKIDLDTPKGIYFLQLNSDGHLTTKKILKE